MSVSWWKTGVDSASKETKNAYMRAGTKYSHFGKRSGIASALDKYSIAESLRQKEVNSGGGAYSFQLLDENGDVDTSGRPLNFGGRLFYPNKDGKYRVLDSTVLNEELKYYEEQEAFVNSILERCMISNEICHQILGSVAWKVLSSNLGGDDSTGEAQIDNARATPDFLNCLDRSSAIYGLGVSKLRHVIKRYMPIMEQASTQQQLNEDV